MYVFTNCCLLFIYSFIPVTVITLTSGRRITDAGGAQIGRYVQWTSGQLRRMDEFKSTGCYLHILRWTEILEDDHMLHSGKFSEIFEIAGGCGG